jgi:membrane associated rhomboid family serine protease
MIVGVLVPIAFALGGRWIQLHPERVVPKGQFVGPNSFGARLFRGQIFFVGTFGVFGGTWMAVHSILWLLTFGSIGLGWAAQLLGVCAGVFAAVYVRNEVKKRPAYVSDSPYGWWP